MANSEQGAGCDKEYSYVDGMMAYCNTHGQAYAECQISALQAKVADLEKARAGMITIEELGEKLRAVEIPLRSRIQALEAALNSYTICGDWCTCGYGWGHAVAREALRPDQGDVKRKCTCGESSPDRLVVHRTDGPCYLRPREGQSAQGGGKPE
jgi:hypothetical protein